MFFGEQVIDYFLNLNTDWKLPRGFDLIKPFEHSDTVSVFTQFYQKYFSDQNERVLILGINPGRHGAGVTGIPFTDPIILNEQCAISNEMKKRHELSAIYVYKFIEAFGGVQSFYDRFYINSVCPLGFLREGINCNYYDDKKLFEAVKPNIISGMRTQVDFGCRTDVVISLGKGQNERFLNRINDEIGLFDKVLSLPHPRWVMQYRRKRVDEFVEEAVSLFSEVLA